MADTKKMFNNILIATDGSPRMRDAISYAGNLFLFSQFHVLTCVDTNVGSLHQPSFLIKILEERAELALHEAEDILGEVGIDPIVVHEKGDPAKAILRYIDKEHIDLMVLGTTTSAGFQRITFGRVGDKVAKKAKCPVLVISGPVDPHVNSILNPTDGQTHSVEAGETAIRLAKYFNAKLTKFYVGSDLDEGRRIVKEAEAKAKKLGVKEVGSIEIVKGDPAAQILDIGKEYDLIVMGNGRRGYLCRDTLCITSREVAAMAPAPVILVS